ncbi:Transcriptional regulator, contains XRE-family HTH domain [Halopseudomonas litoralis]|uniref:Transcriptional regulator, contains XRE-family HTH domain n=1 Tax=Halopseudomonas litoralis TaxID=797277 RepID=A0A1H1SLK0_9GAMM|nr:helix-turn-helix transcriptional regulator [Halopseudomonas litoralis]SDS48713.1 Transcriptional regulator, contains XRE-family HTH domain [Halopseudomonas litoralis]
MVPNGSFVNMENHRMVSIGSRLRELRKEQGQTQEALAEAVGVTKKTQGVYERGERSPDAMYLAAMDRLGFDILYLVTGVRQLPPEASQADHEQALINSYRTLSEQQQDFVRETVAALAAAAERQRK